MSSEIVIGRLKMSLADTIASNGVLQNARGRVCELGVLREAQSVSPERVAVLEISVSAPRHITWCDAPSFPGTPPPSRRPASTTCPPTTSRPHAMSTASQERNLLAVIGDEVCALAWHVYTC